MDQPAAAATTSDCTAAAVAMDVEAAADDGASATHAQSSAASSTAAVAPIAASAVPMTLHSSSPFESTHNAAGTAAVAAAPSREHNASPPASSSTSSNKRHISTAVASYNANHRLTSPSPPKSPVRLRHTAAAAAADCSSSSGAGFLSAPASTSSHSSSSNVTASTDSPNRSPIRIASRDRERSSALRSSSFHSPTRTTPHGLPASPITPTRLKNRQGASNSASPPLTTPQQISSRSPISAFYFPQGLPPSPGTKLTAQTTLRQLSKVHPQGFDADALEQLCVSVLKLPRYLCGYVQQQCLSLQHNRADLRAAVQEQRRIELNRRRIQRQMDSLRRGGAAGRNSNRSSLGTLGAAVKNSSLSGSDMSIDSLQTGTAITSPVADRSAAVAACKSPQSIDDGRSRNVSTTSTTSTALTALSPPGSPLDVADAALNASNASSALLSPLSMSRVSACASSTNNSLLQVSGLAGLEEHDESADAAADAEEAMALAEDQLAQSTEDERVLPETFTLYYSSYLEKFRDPATRFFRVILGAIEHLYDAPAEAPAEAQEAGAAPPRMLQPLHVPSPRTACVPVSQPAAAAPAPCTSPLLSPSSSYLLKTHFLPLLDSILCSHPGLEFLHATPEFQLKYAQTCIERIFYALDARGTGRLSLADIKRSNLLLEVEKLEAEPDINKSLLYFSYQHFYVLYCRFWELDSPDHDGFLSVANLMEYENGALSARICERIIQLCREEDSKRGVAVAAEESKDKDSGMDQSSVCPSDAAADADEFPASDRGACDGDLHTPVMDYAHFIPFMLAEVDKNTAPSLAYWFRALDLDHDHVLSLYELDWFFSEQKEKIQALSSDVIRWNDIVCQLLDMIKNGDDGSAKQQVRPHQVGGSTALPPASGSLQRNVSAESDAMRAAASDVMSVEFSSCLITRKDLARSHLSSYFFNLFFNLPRFLSHESRDPARARSLHEAAEKGISEWEVYAAGMYQSLVANEELQARAAEQLQSAGGHCESTHEDELEPHMEDSEVAAAASAHHVHEEEQEQEQETEQHHSLHVVRRSAARSARSQQQQLQLDDSEEDSDMHDERHITPRSHHASTEHAATVVHVVPSSAPGAPPTFFFVDDEPIEDSSPEVPSTSPASLARAHQPSRPSGVSSPRSPTSAQASKQQQAAASQRAARLRQEEQEYLELQRKIHSSSLRDSSPLSAAAAALDEEEELERIASPPAASRPISIRTSGGGANGPASPQLQKLHIHSPRHATTSPIEAAAAAASADDDAEDDENVASSVSPPYTAPSAAPRSSAAHVLQVIGAAQQSSAAMHDDRASSSSTASAFSLRSPTNSTNKENPVSPSASSALIASTPSAFKRQLQFSGNAASASDKQPLSPQNR